MAPALALAGIVKEFGGVRALDRANLSVARSSVHGLIGQNGAGKSTLIKILAGIHAPDSGTIAVEGETVAHLDPHLAERLGIRFIHQDRLLVPGFTVAEALFLGQEPARGPLLRLGRMRREASRLLRETFDVDLAPDRLVAGLSAAERQVVQITRALLGRPRILVFDEPTATLVRREVDRLFGIIRRLREQGITIVYISHHLREIAALCDQVTVLRNGADVGTVDARATPAATLVSMMVARDIGAMFPPRARVFGRPVLAVRGLARTGRFEGVSFEAAAGEIVGLTGLLGSGAKDVVQALFGLQRPQRGEIHRDGSRVSLGSPAAAVRHGIGLVPEDRRGHGVAPGMSVRENISLASLARHVRRGVLDRGAERRETDRLIGELAIKTPGREARLRELSGGNQQKVALAKWLSRQSSLYLLDEPTVGVDVAAKVEIYRLIADVAGRGAGVLALSSDLPELLGLCHRVLVMYRGRIVYQAEAAATDDDTLLLHATGAAEALHAA